MAYENLKTAIKQAIKQNGNQEITGNLLQSTLLNIVNILGEGATFAGIATPATDPGTPEGNVFYLACEAGEYVNFKTFTEEGLHIFIKNANNAWKDVNLLSIIQELGGVSKSGVTSQLAVSKAVANLSSQFSVDSVLPIENGIEQEISFSASDKIWKKYGRVKSVFLGIRPGSTYKIYGNKTLKGVISFLQDLEFPIEIGSSAKVADFYETEISTIIDEGSSITVKVPENSNTKYLYWRYDPDGSSGAISKVEELKETIEIVQELGGVSKSGVTSQLAVSKAVANLSSQFSVDSVLPIENGIEQEISFSASDKIWKKYGRVKSVFLGIRPGSTYKIYGNKTLKGVISFLQDLEFPIEIGSSAKVADFYETEISTIIDEGSSITVKVPENSNTKYLYWRYDPDGSSGAISKVEELKETIEIVQELGGVSKNNVAKIFDIKLNQLNADNITNSLFNSNKLTLNEDYAILPIGYANHIDYKDAVVFDDEVFLLDVSKSSNDDILMLQSIGEQNDDAITYSEYSLNHNTLLSGVASKMKVDFKNRKLQIYIADNISLEASSEDVLAETDFDNSGTDFIIRWGRHKRQVFLSIYNCETSELYKCIADDYDKAGSPSESKTFRPAGWMYYAPSFYQVAGQTKFKRFRCYIPDNLDYIFQGDSYTQGYAGLYKNCWANLAAESIGNCLTGGMSGSKLLSVVNQYKACIKNKVHVKSIVISIGINDSGNINPSTINKWINVYKTYIEELIADGINPIVNLIWPNNVLINNAIYNLGYDGADFSKINNHSDIYVIDHLTEKGNRISYKIFMNYLQLLRP